MDHTHLHFGTQFACMHSNIFTMQYINIDNSQPTSLNPSLQLRIDPIDTYEDFTMVSHTLFRKAAWFRLVFVRSGQGGFWIDMQQHELHRESVFLVRPGLPFGMQNGSRLKGWIISFGESFLDMDDEKTGSWYLASLLRFFSNRQVMPLQPGIMNELDETIGKMTKELRHPYLFSTEILKRYFKILIMYLSRQMETAMEESIPNRPEELVNRFMAMLEKNFYSKKMVADYASDLLLTPNYLNQIVKKITGHSAGHHIRQRVVLEAKRKALYSDKCMKEIAYHLGFSDPCHFSKFFKKATGVNFIDFKKGSAMPALLVC